jgi:tetratricopeptide (TPR) repeat protein
LVERAARTAVHTEAGDRGPEVQETLFDLLLELVASGEETAFLILGEPKLTSDDLTGFDPATAALVVDFARRLHEELAIELARPDSPFTAAAITSTLDRLVRGLSNLGDTVNIRADQIVDQLSSIQSDLRGTIAQDAGSLPLAPPVASALGRALAVDVDTAQRLKRQLLGTDDVDVVLAPLLSAEPPGWWAAASGPTVLAAAAFAAAHNQGLAASRLYDRAADLEGVDRVRCLALAGFYVADTDRSRAREFVARATGIDADDLVTVAVTAILDDEPQTALERLGSALHADDNDALFIAGIQRWSLERLNRLSDAIGFARAVIERLPNAAGMRLHLSRMLRQRAETEGTRREADLAEALASALEARQLRRSWHGDSSEAVFEACLIAGADDAWDDVLRLGLPAPDGEALPAEAVAPQVAGQVATAAVLLRRPEVARSIAVTVADEFTRHLVAGWLAELDGDKEAAVVELTAAESTATDGFKKGWALRGLAGLGVWPLPGLDEFADDNPEHGELITAISEMSRGLNDEAAERLRPLRRVSPQAPIMLPNALEEAGHPDHAVDELRAGYAATGDPAMLVQACRVLARSDRLDDAERLAEESMALVPAGRPAVHQFRRLLIELAGRRGDDRRVEDLCATAFAEGDPDPRVRWNLAHALHKRTKDDDAWDVLQAEPALRPRTDGEAELWLHVHAGTSPERATVRQMLDVVALFPESEHVLGAALVLFYTRGGEREVRDDEGAEVQALASSFIERWPNSRIMWAKSVTPDDPALFAKQIEEIARSSSGRRKQTVDSVEMYAAGRLPLGMVAHVAGSTLTEALAGPLTSQIVTRSENEDETASSVAVAAAAVNDVVVIDLTGVHVAAIGEGRWKIVVAAFRRIETVDAVVADVQSAIANLSLNRAGHIGFDELAGRPVVTEADPARDARDRGVAESLATILSGIDVRGCARLGLFPDFDDGRSLAWLGPVQAAKDAGRALYSDDLGLRRLAASVGVPAFGTLDLIDGLVSAGRLDQADATEWRRELHGAHVVDVYTDVDALLVSGGPLTGLADALGRRWVWTTSGALALTLDALDRSGDPGLVQLASYWFAVGAARHDPPTAAARCAGRIVQLVGSLTTPGGAGAVGLIRHACIDRGIDDPLPPAVLSVKERLEEEVGDEAGRLTVELFSQVDDASQRVVLRTIALS